MEILISNRRRMEYYYKKDKNIACYKDSDECPNLMIGYASPKEDASKLTIGIAFEYSIIEGAQLSLGGPSTNNSCNSYQISDSDIKKN